jgi:dUTP pyrophosphatase
MSTLNEAILSLRKFFKMEQEDKFRTADLVLDLQGRVKGLEETNQRLLLQNEEGWTKSGYTTILESQAKALHEFFTEQHNVQQYPQSSTHDPNDEVAYPTFPRHSELAKVMTLLIDLQDRMYAVEKGLSSAIRRQSPRPPEVKFIKLDERAVIPEPTNEFAVGWDLTTIEFETGAGGFLVGHTGLAVEIPPEYFLMICVRSSAPAKGFVLSNGIGIIDPDYRGEILSKFLKRVDQYYLKGPIVITQAILLPRTQFRAVEASDLSETERGTGGFGSTDKEADDA